MQSGETITVCGRFESQKYTGGILLTIKDMSVTASVAIKPGKELKGLNIKSGLAAFRKELESLKSAPPANEQAGNLVSRITTHFSTKIARDKVEKITRLYKTSRDEFLKNILIRDLILDEMKDIFEDTALHLEIMTSPDEAAAPEAQKPVDAAKEDTGNEGLASPVTIVHPLIDPAAGVSAGKLKPGMVVYVKTHTGEEFSRLSPLLSEDGDADPAKCSFRIRLDSLDVQNRPEYGDARVYGVARLGDNEIRLECSADLRIRVSVDETPVSDETEESSGEDEGGFGNHIITGAIGLLVLLVIALVYVILN